MTIISTGWVENVLLTQQQVPIFLLKFFFFISIGRVRIQFVYLKRTKQAYDEELKFNTKHTFDIPVGFCKILLCL